MRCRLNTNMWYDILEYNVIEYSTRPNSTSVNLTLETSEGEIIKRVVANHLIEWIDDED